MLILRPKGRGNWKPLVLAVEGERVGAMTVRVGQTLVLGGILFRIAKVMP